MNDVASYIDDRPDSALAVLESIRNEELTTRPLRARYSLLYAMALDKNYIDTTDASIIMPAVQCYNRCGSVDDKIKAYYYQGIAYLNGKEYDKAIVSFTIAEELIPQAHDMRYVGLLYSRMSDLYNCTYNSEQELRYIDLAMDAFAECKANNYKYTTLHRKAQALANAKRTGEASRIYESLINEAGLPKSLVLTAKGDYALLLSTVSDGDTQRALNLYESVLSESGGLRDINQWASYAYTLTACGHSNESVQVFNQLYTLYPEDTAVIDIWKASAFEQEQEFGRAFYLLKHSLSQQDSLLNIKLSQASTRALVEHVSYENSKLQVAKKNNQIRSILMLLLIVTIAVAVFLYLRRRNEKLMKERIELIDIAEVMRFKLKESEEGRYLEKKEFENTVNTMDSEISLLRQEVKAKEQTLYELRSEYARIYHSQFKYLGDLCETYLRANERRDSQRIVYEKVQDMIKDISLDENGQKRFEHKINNKLDGIMRHFREDYSWLSEKDYRFVSYLFVGFDATTISIILNMPSVDAVYMRKSRIKKMIRESNTKRKETYLDIMP